MSWTFGPLTTGSILLGAVVYGLGVRAAWRHAGPGMIFGAWQVASFALGMLALMVALMSPLAWLAELTFSAHMTQHEVLMLVAAPLVVFGQPLLAVLWAVPALRRADAARAVRGPWTLAVWRWLTAPLIVFVLHAGALWVWHVPVLFEWALRDHAVHAVQHLSFFLTAALFWWAMAHGRYGRAGYGLGVLFVFLTALHNTLLAALLTIAPAPWYRSYVAAESRMRIDALADQQLAGMIMWVPSGVIFIVVGLALLAGWLGESERRAQLGQAATPSLPGARRAR